MIYNFHNMHRDEEMRARCSPLIGGKCLVDEAEVKQVWYIDTDLGLVKTYDVWGDGKARAVIPCSPDDVPSDAENVNGGIWSRTITGTVKLVRPISL